MNGYEAIAQLPEDIQKLALIEIGNQRVDPKSCMSQDFYTDTQDFLLQAFYWEESTQGHDFWAEKAGIEPATV
jgi:hypothetical protein